MYSLFVVSPKLQRYISGEYINITVGNGIYAGGGVLGGSNAVALSDPMQWHMGGTAVVNGANGEILSSSIAHHERMGNKEVLNGLRVQTRQTTTIVLCRHLAKTLH